MIRLTLLGCSSLIQDSVSAKTIARLRLPYHGPNRYLCCESKECLSPVENLRHSHSTTVNLMPSLSYVDLSLQSSGSVALLWHHRHESRMTACHRTSSVIYASATSQRVLASHKRIFNTAQENILDRSKSYSPIRCLAFGNPSSTVECKVSSRGEFLAFS